MLGCFRSAVQSARKRVAETPGYARACMKQPRLRVWVVSYSVQRLKPLRFLNNVLSAALHSAPYALQHRNDVSLRLGSNPGGHHKVLRIFCSRVVYAVQFVGMNECRASGSDHRGLSSNGHCERALHHQEEFFVLMPVWGMRLTSRAQCRLVHFQVITGMCQAVQDWPGFVLPILLYG